MTQNEKKASNSEITAPNPSGETGLHGFRFETHYTILSLHDPVTYSSPVDGFVNMLMAEGNGTSTYVLNTTSYIIRGGESILHPIQKGHLLEWKNLCKDDLAILFFIPLSVLDEFHLKVSDLEKKLENGFMTRGDFRLNLIVKQILELSLHPSYLSKLRVQPLIAEAFALQMESLYAEDDKQQAPVDKNLYDKVQLAKKIIETDLSRNYTIRQLAKEVGTNEQYLKKYFKQYVGKTVMNYITDVKMEHAKNLIKTGEYRISDVARLTGYKHSTHFTTAFKRFFGFIPNSLRYALFLAQEELFAEVPYFMNTLIV